MSFLRPPFITALPCVLLVLAALRPALAQQSATYDLREHTVNSGGSPQDGVAPQSPTYRLGLDAIGDPVAVPALASASFALDVGFVIAYPPPGETTGLLFTGKTTFTWDPEKSTGVFNVYRGLVSALPGGFGGCLQAAIPAPGAIDAATPPPGECFFYLVTAKNRIAEEGTKGYQSTGAERPNPTPCP